MPRATSRCRPHHGPGLGEAEHVSDRRQFAPRRSDPRRGGRGMRLPQEIIRDKRDGRTLSEADIAGFIGGLTDERVTEGQAAAFAMAVFFRGPLSRRARGAHPRHAGFRLRAGLGPARPHSRQAFHRRRRRHGEPRARPHGRGLRRLRADDFGPRSRPYRRHPRQARQHPRLRRGAGARPLPRGGAGRRLRHHRPDGGPRPGRPAPLRHPRRHRHGRIPRPDHGLDPLERSSQRASTASSWT